MPSPVRNYQMLQEIFAGRGPFTMKADVGFQSIYNNLSDEAIAQLEDKGWGDFLEHTTKAEALYRLGQCQLIQKQFVQARRTWKDLLADHVEHNSERIAEAAYNLSKTYRIPAPTSDENLSLGVASLESFVEKYPKSQFLSEMEFVIASCLEEEEKLEEAYQQFKSLKGRYPYPTLLKMKLEGIESRIQKKADKKGKSKFPFKTRAKKV